MDGHHVRRFRHSAGLHVGGLFMRTNRKSQRLLVASLEKMEASGNVEPGSVRAAKAALRGVQRSRTRVQRDRALNKLARVFLRTSMSDE